MDYAANGDEEAGQELKDYADPDSATTWARLRSAAVNCEPSGERLLDYKAAVPRELLTKLDRVKMQNHPEILASLQDAGLSTIKCVEDASWTAGQGPWSRGLIPTEKLGEGAQFRKNPTVARLKNVPTTLSGIVTNVQRPAGAGVFVEFDVRDDCAGVLVFHAAGPERVPRRDDDARTGLAAGASAHDVPR